MKVLGVIPARMASVRFPGKVLADIGGKPMIWHVYKRARNARSLTHIIVATDSETVFDACRANDMPVTLTRADHPTGTDRVAEVAALIQADVYVNIQGDEPLIDPNAIDRTVRGIEADDVANACSAIHDPASVVSSNVVKVVLGVAGDALMFSRSPIPFPKDGHPRYLRQFGLYAFRPDALKAFAAAVPGPLEITEGVEMLRFIEHGLKIRMVEVPDTGSISVDTPSDLDRVKVRMAA